MPSSSPTNSTTLASSPKKESPASGGFRPGGFRPGGASRAAGLRPSATSSAASTGGNNNTATTEGTTNGENVNANVGGNDSARRPFIYSKQMLLSLRDEEYCVCKPDDLPGEFSLSIFMFL